MELQELKHKIFPNICFGIHETIMNNLDDELSCEPVIKIFFNYCNLTTNNSFQDLKCFEVHNKKTVIRMTDVLAEMNNLNFTPLFYNHALFCVEKYTLPSKARTPTPSNIFKFTFVDLNHTIQQDRKTEYYNMVMTALGATDYTHIKYDDKIDKGFVF